MVYLMPESELKCGRGITNNVCWKAESWAVILVIDGLGFPCSPGLQINFVCVLVVPTI